MYGKVHRVTFPLITVEGFIDPTQNTWMMAVGCPPPCAVGGKDEDEDECEI